MNHTHKSLCALACDWLKRPSSRKGPGCLVALSETQSGMGSEIPDALGWRPVCHTGGGSVLVEVKVSLSDFRADAKKAHRKHPEKGMGNYRYYLAPEGVIPPEEIPEGWGFLEVNARGHVKVFSGHVLTRHNTAQWHHPCNHSAETALLVRVLNRVEDPQAVQDRIREAENRAGRLLALNDKMRLKNDALHREVYRLKRLVDA